VNLLDENIIDSQRRLLNSWRIPVRQIGYEVGRKGIKDREIIPFLHQLNQPTFFTRDDKNYVGFYRHWTFDIVNRTQQKLSQLKYLYN
jgi:hypothetical protein